MTKKVHDIIVYDAKNGHRPMILSANWTR